MRILRFANLYGPYGKGYPEFGFINYFIHRAWRGEEIQVFGTGEQLRNVMFVDDATEILCRAAREPQLVGGTFFAPQERLYGSEAAGDPTAGRITGTS